MRINLTFEIMNKSLADEYLDIDEKANDRGLSRSPDSDTERSKDKKSKDKKRQQELGL